MGMAVGNDMGMGNAVVGVYDGVGVQMRVRSKQGIRRNEYGTGDHQ